MHTLKHKCTPLGEGEEERKNCMIKLIAIDMDATLLNDQKEYDRFKFNHIVKKLNEMGVIIAIASGNSYEKLRKYIDESIRPSIYFVGDNGNHIVKNDETIFVKAMAKQTVIDIMILLKNLGGFYPMVSTTKSSYSLDEGENALSYFGAYNPEIQLIDHLDNLPNNEPLVKLATMSEHAIEVNKSVANQIVANFPEVAAVTSGEKWVDVYVHDGGKGTGLQFLLNKYQIHADDCMAFGDSLNDYTMMQLVKYSMAMGNADLELANICHYQIGTNEDGAVVSLLEELLAHDTVAFLEKYRRH